MLRQKHHPDKAISTTEKQANPYFDVPMKKGKIGNHAANQFKLEKPLPKKVWQEIVREFDGANTRGASDLWWSSKAKENKPSFAPEITNKGTAFIWGSDLTDGKVQTILGITRDGKTIFVDGWNLSTVKRILEEHHVPFTRSDFSFYD